ncbi:hypothetical protein Tco_0133032 [Tanacetum coccineum]
MTSPNKPTSKPSRVAKMSVKPIWRKKPNLCNTSNVLNATSPMPKPLTPHHEPSQENNHPNQALPNPYIKDTTTSPQVVSHPPLPISLINSHVAHIQAPPQSDNQTQHTPPLSTRTLCTVFSAIRELVDIVKKTLELGAREVMDACPKRTGAGWTTIYSQMRQKLDALYKTKAELELDLSKQLEEQYLFIKLNLLAKKKR